MIIVVLLLFHIKQVYSLWQYFPRNKNNLFRFFDTKFLRKKAS